MSATRRERLRREWPRKVLHLGVGLGALALPFLPRLTAASLAALAVLANGLWRRFAPRSPIFRADERGWGGVVLYPVVVLLAIALLPYPRGAMAVWGALAAGDAAASLVGLALGGPTWPWNRRKSVVGSLAFALCAAAAIFGLLRFAGDPVDPLRPALVLALVGALAESLPWRMDDNLAIGLACGLAWVGLEALA
ncbi:MAG: hypothetical protein R3F20_01625 [Planctomycetota bacterium]